MSTWEKLKQCPFILTEKEIGHNPYTLYDDGFWFFQCTCGARSPLSPTEDYAIQSWKKER